MIIARTIAECREQREAWRPGICADDGGVTCRARYLDDARAAARAERGREHLRQSDAIRAHRRFGQISRPLEADLHACEQAGVDLVFLPTAAEVYRPGLPAIEIRLPSLFGVLEGEHRPDHFAGVCQVVAKLFNIVRPNVAVFGQKDFQQLRIIMAMVEALDFPIHIIAGPTLREPDGLAMSSRNIYLTPEERQQSLSISRGLFAAQGMVQRGIKEAKPAVERVREEILKHGLRIDYVAAVDPVTLAPVDQIRSATVLAVAARVGATRLIDNIVVGGSWPENVLN